MNPIETRMLGKSGVRVTQLGFGGAGLGELFVRVDEATAAATLQTAWDEGIRYYDTAPFYGRGLSEIRTGRFLDNKPRSEFVLSTKVGRWFFPPAKPDSFETGFWAGGLRFEHVHDYSYDGIMRAYDQSQLRLGMNRIDLLVIHDLDFWFHETEEKVAAYLAQLFTSGWRALDQLRSHKLVRGVGAGINELGMIPRFLDALDLDFFLLAMRYTLLEQETLESELPTASAEISGSSSVASTIRASPRPARSRAPNTITRTRCPTLWTGSPGSRACAGRMAYRLQPRRCSSRSGTRPWPPSFPERSIPTKSGRTRRIFVTRFPPRSGRT
jgi:aryl-alcohol dehydrogenase-like predicted oxidoreductase